MSVIPSEKALLRRSVMGALAASVLILLLTWAGFVAVRQWQQNVLLLADRQAGDAADLFLTELTRDMQAVQRTVLMSPELEAFARSEPLSDSPSDSPYDAVNLVAGAFARYCYPESFFLWHGQPGASPTFFYRQERRPPWDRDLGRSRRFPVIVDPDPPMDRGMLELIRREAGSGGRPFVVLETTIDGTPYQVVARVFYRDSLHRNIGAVFGFLVNLTWTRDHYFAEFLRQSLPKDASRASAVALAIRDARGSEIAADRARVGSGSGSVSRRTFPPIFFNPLLVAAQPFPAERNWTIEGATRPDSSLMVAARAAGRMLILQIVAAAMLAAGILLSVRAARASVRLSETRSDFVASVTHEFKTPLATIRAAAETLAAGRLESAAQQQDYARFIVEEGRRLTRLVDNLLAFSRITEPVDIRRPLGRVALGGVVNQTLARFSVQLDGDGFQVEVSVPADLPPLQGDPTALTLMLENIVDNALRHSRKERRLEIRATSDPRSVLLEIADRGGGIPEDEIEHVTKKFYRGRHAGQGGTGLGLAIASRIAASHGGSLKIRNQPGVGTTVLIRLPMNTNRPIAEEPEMAGAETR